MKDENIRARKYLVVANSWCVGITLIFSGYLLFFSPFVAIRHESAQGAERIARIVNTDQLRDECETMALELQGAFVRKNTDLPIFSLYVLFVLGVGGVNLFLIQKLENEASAK